MYQGMLKRDGDKLHVSEELPLMKVFMYGDWKTIEGILGLIESLYEHAELDDVCINNERELLQALEKCVLLHGDLHVSFHLLDAIYRLAYDGFMDMIQKALGVKRVTKDPLKRVFASRDLVKITSSMLLLAFFRNFMQSEGEDAASVLCFSRRASCCSDMKKAYVMETLSLAK
mmetsp:Transcript_18048/g.39445  ORF Transcript_18048/g.39445 Transcript_18048/m.39445 type:complete len:173 (-) Transcript_18048:986-1504(-)